MSEQNAAAGGAEGAADKIETIAGGDAGAAAAAGTDKGAGAADAGKTADAGVAADWRTKLAGEDKDFAKTLSRYTDEAAFGKAHRALLSKMSSGEYKRGLPEGAKPEEVAAWRKENGLPENEAGYVEKLELPNGIVLGEADKPIVAEFAKAALASNVDPKAFNGMVSQYYNILDQQKAQRAEADANYKRESDDALRAVWTNPQEYRQNLNAIQNLMAGWPEGLADRVLAGRSADGKTLGDDPAFIRQLATLARELNPTSTLVPAGTNDPGKTVNDELEQIRKLRRDDPSKYEADKKMQSRELELIEAQLRLKKRAAA